MKKNSNSPTNNCYFYKLAALKAVDRLKPNTFILIKDLKNQQTSFDVDLIAQKLQSATKDKNLI